MATALMVKCKACGATFPSPMQMDRRAFEDAREEDMAHFRESGEPIPDEVQAWHSLRADLTCPQCGETRSYQKPDYFFDSGTT